ncbi:MAG: ribonuclease domain-containing protein [Anaerofustis sp.]
MNGWTGSVPGQTEGTKAGAIYRNEDGFLPEVDELGNSINYREFDVKNKHSDECRDAERFVVGTDGSVYYTDSHYGDIESPRGLPSFIKLN